MAGAIYVAEHHDLGEPCRGHASLYLPDVWWRQQQARCLKAKQCKSEHVLCKLYYMCISKAAEAQIHRQACQQLTWQSGIGLACSLPQYSQTQA